MPVVINGSTGISGVDGSAGTPAFQGSDTNTGIRFGTDIVSLVTGGSDRLYIDSSGRLGVGTTSPSTLLHLNSSSASAVYLRLENTGGYAYFGVDGSGNAYAGAESNDAFGIVTNGTYRMYITAGGNVGIGTTTVDQLLHVLKNQNGETGILVDNQWGTSGANSSLTLKTADVAGSSTSTFAINKYKNGSVSIANNETNSAANIAFVVGSSERARLDSSGRWLVGTSTDRFSTKLLVEGTDGTGGATFARSSNDAGPPYSFFIKSRGTNVGSNTVVQSGDTLGFIGFYGTDGTSPISGASIQAQVDATPGTNDMPGRLVFSTTADGASTPTERVRINNTGIVSLASSVTNTTVSIVEIQGGSSGRVLINNYSQSGNEGWNGSNTVLFIGKQGPTSRSINAAGTINASGADYAEYMVKAGNFDIAKGAVCGVTADGLLTIEYGDAVSFVVKSTNPSYVGGDTWGTEYAIGVKPNVDDVEALTRWEADLEAARKTVDRIAFAGQVPVNVLGATPGQYIVPMKAADGGIEGIAKNEADLTLAEYMRAVGKVIAIEDDGRARIIVKVA